MLPLRHGHWMVLAELCAAGCGGEVILGGPAEGGSAATTTSTTSVSTSTTDGGSTTTGACDADLTEALGASDGCNACTGTYCCPQGEAFLASPSASTYEALVTCGAGADGAGPCATACRTNLCQSELDYFYAQACADCLNTWCCGPFGTCMASSTCGGPCLYGFDSSCCANALFVEWDSCATTSCSEQCAGGWCGG